MSVTIQEIKKRNGNKVPFDPEKITNAILKAIYATNGHIDNTSHKETAVSITNYVLGKVNKSTPSVEDIQDIVESTLIESGYSDIAKEYILYRHDRRRIRDSKKQILNLTELDPVSKRYNESQLQVLASRYLFRDDNNAIRETPTQLFERVAILIGIGDMMRDIDIFNKDNHDSTKDIDTAKSYLDKIDEFDGTFHIGEYYLNKYHFRSLIMLYIDLSNKKQTIISFKDLLRKLAEGKYNKYQDNIKQYYDIMVDQIFLPNSPTLMNAGGRLGQLSACFVLDMQDNMKSIMKCASDVAIIFQSGGGVGINYSNLRHEGDIVSSTSGVASGPVSFMNIINTVTNVVKQGGKRRGANMGIMDVNHPDIIQFVEAKSEPGVLENFNVSVGIDTDFWNALINNTQHTLVSPRTGQDIDTIDTNYLLEKIATCAWRAAEPGVIFFDNVNKHNVMYDCKGPIRATNPCGEQSLYPFESCNLGSINVGKLVYVKDGKYEFDWDQYEKMIRLCTRFLDNIVDTNVYPLPEIDSASKGNRRIGLGVMGVADLLLKLEIPYNSKQGYELQSRLAECMSYYSMVESVELAKERGKFSDYENTTYKDGKLPISGYYDIPKDQHNYDWDILVDDIKENGIRNVVTSTVAPTGTISMIAGCSSGIEPTFGLSYTKNVTVGTFTYTNDILKEKLIDKGLYTPEIIQYITEHGNSIANIKEIPQEIRDVFVTSMDVHWADHVYAQCIWQKWIANSISKTINMPSIATSNDIKSAYILAHELGLKGITVYRDESRHEQVMHCTDNSVTKPSQFIIQYIQDNIKLPDHLNIHIKVEKPVQEVEKPVKTIPVEIDNKHQCPNCAEPLAYQEGCRTCIICGYSACSS